MWLTNTENFVKFVCFAFEICEWTDRLDIQTRSLRQLEPLLEAD